MGKNIEDDFEEILKESGECCDPPESVINMFMNTSFNNVFMSREEAIKAAKNLSPKLQEQIYGKNSRLYFHASARPHDPVKESYQRSGESLCFFANKPEAAIAVARVRHNWSYDFCFLHVCKLKSPLNLFNPQCELDFKKVSFSQRVLNEMEEVNDWLKTNGIKAPERWWRIYESKSIAPAIRRAGFLGMALNFWDMKHETPDMEKTEGIALFNGNQMKVCGIKAVNLKDKFKNYDWYLKDIKKKEDIEKEYKDFLYT